MAPYWYVRLSEVCAQGRRSPTGQYSTGYCIPVTAFLIVDSINPTLPIFYKISGDRRFSFQKEGHVLTACLGPLGAENLN